MPIKGFCEKYLPNLLPRVNKILQSTGKIPAPVKMFAGFVIFLLFYVRFNINLMPLIFLIVVWKAGFYKWLGDKFGGDNAKTAVKIVIGAAVFYLLMFWNFKTAPYGDFWFDTDQFLHIIPKKDNHRHPLYFIWYWIWSLFAPSDIHLGNTLSVRYFIVVLSSLMAGMFYLFSSMIGKNSRFSRWLTVAFVISAPMLIHTALVTDTFLCSSFSIMLCVLYFTYAINNKIHDLRWLIPIGILMFGTTPTNVIVFSIFYLVLLFNLQISLRDKIKLWMKAVMIFILVFAVIALLGLKSPLKIIFDIMADKNDFNFMINGGLLQYADKFFETMFLNFDFKILPGDSLWAVLLLVPAVFIRRIKTKPVLFACYGGLLFYFVFFMFFGGNLYIFSPIYNVLAFAVLAHLPQVWNKSEIAAMCLVAVLLPVNFLGAGYIRNIDKIMRHKSDYEIIGVSLTNPINEVFFGPHTTKNRLFQQELDAWHEYEKRPRSERIWDSFRNCLSKRHFR